MNQTMHTWNSPWKYNGRSRFTFKKHNRWFRFTLKSESESGPSIMFSWSFIYIFFMYPIFSLRIRVAYFFFSPFSGKISKQWLSVEVITTLMVPVCKSPKPWYVLQNYWPIHGTVTCLDYFALILWCKSKKNKEHIH